MILLGVLCVVMAVLKLMFFATFRIPTDSMQSTLQSGDNILVNKWIMGARIFDIWEAAEEKEVEIHRLLGLGIQEYRFQENYYFMGGDNMENSKDSRSWGLLPEPYIVGV